MAEASSSTAAPAPTVVRPENVDEPTYAAMQLYRSVSFTFIFPSLFALGGGRADGRKSRNTVV
jgi:hypothetical protein